MTATTEYLSSPEIITINYRLQMLNAIADGLEGEMSWSASCDKSVTLALIKHAVANTEADLFTAQGLNHNGESEDPWAFTAPEGAEKAEVFDLDQLICLATNHIKLNPLSTKNEISGYVVAELREIGADYLDGSKLANAIDLAFAKKQVTVRPEENTPISNLIAYQSELIGIADYIFATNQNLSRPHFREVLSPMLAKAGIELSEDDIQKMTTLSFLRQALAPARRGDVYSLKLIELIATRLSS